MAHVNPIQVQKFLKGVDYPASKAALLEKAKSMGADDNVCASLEQLPDEEFQTPADVSQAFGRLPDDVSGSAQGGRGQKEGKAGEGGRKEEARAGHKAGGAERKEEPRAAKAGEHGHKEAAGAAHKGAEARKEEAHAEPKEHRRAPAHAAEGEKRRYTGGNEFLIEAMQDSMAEIQICEMAIEKSANPDVKKFAQSMIDEHGRMGRELEQLAGDKKLDVPRNVRPEQEMTVDEFTSLQGRDFEQRWIQYNIDVHERDVKVFRHYADMEDDPDIRDLAKNQVEALGKHLKMAHEVGKKLARP
jgi:predicted outer membrane protein